MKDLTEENEACFKYSNGCGQNGVAMYAKTIGQAALRYWIFFFQHCHNFFFNGRKANESFLLYLTIGFTGNST